MERSNHARNPRVVHYRLDGGETLLLHLETGAYHEINPVGAAVWDLLDGSRDPSEIATDLREQVRDPPEEEELERFIADFLAELEERDLLV